MRRDILLPVLLLGCVMLAPGAAAESASLALTTPEPVEIDAQVEAIFAGGAGHLWINEAQGAFELRANSGLVTVETWNVTRLPDGRSTVSDGRVAHAEHPVANATLVFTLSGEMLRLNLLAGEGGAIVARGPVEASGRQTYLAQGVASEGPQLTPSLGGRYVPFSLDAGDAFVGFYASPSPNIGFPHEREATLDLRGDVVLQSDGGFVSFVDAEGRQVEYQLGHAEDPALPAGQNKYSRLIFEGDAIGADIPAYERWIAGGPEAAWDVAGTLVWRNATGTVTTAEGTRSFRDETVRGDVLGRVLPSDPGVAPTAPVEYRASGEWSSLSIGGTPAARQAPPVVQAAGIGAALALLLAGLSDWGRGVAGRVVGAFYTRIAPSRVLDHPARAAMHEIVASSPGIHLRELHRRIGGAWGPFTFHVRMLEKANVILVRKEGRYQAAYLPQTIVEAPLLRNPTAERVLDALGAGPTSVPAIATSTGLSRQLVRHHLKALQAQGLVTQLDAKTWSRSSRTSSDAPEQGARSPIET